MSSALPPVLLVLHVLPAAVWFGITAALARLGPKGSSLPLRSAQVGTGTATVLFGLGLWMLLHRGEFGPPEQLLGAGAAFAAVAALLQEVAWWSARRTNDQIGATFAPCQRLSALLLALALIVMLVFRFI